MKPPLCAAKVPATLDGARLDRVLPALVEGLSRVRARKMIVDGSVFVDGRRARVCSRPVRVGQEVVCHEPQGAKPDGDRDSGEPRIVLEADGAIVLDKPAGMPVEPTRAGVRGTVSDWLRRRGLPALTTHRLDAATSGLLVVANDRAAQAELNHLFARHEIRRRYLAVVSPAPDWNETVLSAALDGRSARTHATVQARSEAAALLVIDLDTGRTRQIRRHMAGAATPVVGDRDAPGSVRASRLLLHAFAVSLTLRGRALEASAPPPGDFLGEAGRLGLAVPGDLRDFR